MSQQAPSNCDLINDRLEKKIAKYCLPKFEPRRYQKEFYEEALRRNVIIYLGTGLGKTFITVLYLNDPRVDLLISQQKRKAVFLATTQDLVKQQAEYLNAQIRFRVKIYCSRTGHVGQHIDHWNEAIWQDELENIDVLFMTAQIFLNAVSSGFIRWDQLSVVFFDECHHGQTPRKASKSGSQYYQLMNHYKNYYIIHSSMPKPRIIGLTASLVNSRPKNREDVVRLIRDLEQHYQSVCRTDLVVQGEKPKMILQTYEQPTTSEDDISKLLNNMVNVMNVRLKVRETNSKLDRSTISEQQKRDFSFVNRLMLAAAGFSIKPSSFPKVLFGLKVIHERCGIWALKTVCDLLSKAVKLHTMGEVALEQNIKRMYELFKDILRCISESLEEFLMLDTSYEIKFLRPKPNALLNILKSEYDRATREASELGEKGKTFSCIVFVESRLEVVALNYWLQRRSQIDLEYNFIKSDYAIGIAATQASKYSCITKRKPSEQSTMLNRFRNGDLNVIITTSVLEEGIDLPRCSTVIRYDPPKNFRQYVQSRGRARQNISSFVLMAEKSNLKDEIDRLDKLNDIEHTVRNAFANNSLGIEISSSRTPTTTTTRPPTSSSESPKESMIKGDNDPMKEEIFCTDEMRIQITPSNGRIILHMYCARLKKATPFAGDITYEHIQPTPNTYQTSLELPSGCPHQGPIIGNAKMSIKMADDSAVIKAIKILYDLKELDEHVVPVRESKMNMEKILDDSNIIMKKDQLDKDQAGEMTEDKTFLFKPKYMDIRENLMANCERKSYKFISVQFKPDPKYSRNETNSLFKNPDFGLILDNCININSLPKLIYSHYGTLDVEYKLISDNFQLTSAYYHDKLMDYMYQMFAYGLKLDRMDKSLFKSKCLVYAVILDSRTSSKIDHEKMRNAFTTKSVKIYSGDIVRLNRYYTQNQRSGFYLVKNAQTNLTVNSQIPGRNVTFLEDARKKYGSKVVGPQFMDQPIVEVIQISEALPTFKRSLPKSGQTRYQSSSLYFLDQMLDYVEIKASSLLQLYSLSIIMFRAYQMTVASDLENSLLETIKNRHNIVDDNVVNPPMEVQLPSLVDQQQTGGDTEKERQNRVNYEIHHSELLKDNNKRKHHDDIEISEDDIMNEDDISLDEDDDENDLDEDECDRNESDYLSSEEDDENSLLEPEEEEAFYNRIMSKGIFSLEEHDDKDDLKRWDMRAYKVTDLESLDFQILDHSNNPNDVRSYATSVNYLTHFNDLHLKVSIPFLDLCKHLESFQFIATNSNWLLDNEKELAKREAKVDLNLKPTVTFDNFNKPFAELTTDDHDVGILEAITLKSAQEIYDLEMAENFGDSFLKYLVTVVLYRRLEAHEGLLTSARSMLVGNKYFEYLAKRKNLGSYAIKTGFSKNALAVQFGRPASKAGDPKSYYTKLRSKELADMFEAIIGHYLAYHGQFKALMAIEWLGLDIFSEDIFETIGENSIRFAKFPTSFINSVNPDQIEQFYKPNVRKVILFEDIIGYKFNDKSHLMQAFTHPTHQNKFTRSYERLEFLGDALLDFLVTATIYKSKLAKNPGQVTSSRSALVNNYVFAKLAIEYKFDMFVMYFNQIMYDQLSRVRMAIIEDPDFKFLDMIDYDPVVKLLADLFEAVAGAIYIDSGGSLDQVWSIYYPMMHKNIMRELQNPSRNPVRHLFESFPGRNRISFETREERVGDNNIQMRVTCHILDYRKFEGTGNTKRQAKLRAIQNVLNNLPGVEELAELNNKFNANHPGPQQNRFPNPKGKPKQIGNRLGAHHHQRGNNQKSYNRSKKW